MYESMNVSLPDAHFGVFCLTCRQQSNSNKTLLYSTGCNDKEASFCVKSNGEAIAIYLTTLGTTIRTLFETPVVLFVKE